MNELPKVSVIIPFYNGKQWLYEAIESVLTQTYPNIEIILVNDGSKEDITELIEKYAGKIRYFYQTNKGVAAARNWGMSQASGDFIAFLDSDDIWLPQKTEKQVRFMLKTGAQWSHTGFYYWYPEQNMLKIIDNSVYFGDVRKVFYITMKVATPSVIVTKQLLLEKPGIKFPEDFIKGEDTQFYRAIANKYPLALIEEPLLKVRMRGDNSYKQALRRFETNAKAFLLYKNDPNVPSIAKIIMSIYFIYHKLLGTNESRAKTLFAKALWTIPFVLERIFGSYYNATSYHNPKYILRASSK